MQEMSLGRFKQPNLTSSHRVFPLLRLTIKNWAGNKGLELHL